MKKSWADRLLDNHGPKIGAMCMALSSLVMIGLMSLAFTLTLPKWIEIQERLSAGLQVAESIK